eukprot:m.26328 g.26328  ORF g.26328 m.26328 type:complete len:243 (-) comp15359_c0_seq1:192-920(-)
MLPSPTIGMRVLVAVFVALPGVFADTICEDITGYSLPDVYLPPPGYNASSGKCLAGARSLVYTYSAGYKCSGQDCPDTDLAAAALCDSSVGCVGFQWKPNPGGVFMGQETVLITLTQPIPTPGSEETFSLVQSTGATAVVNYRDYDTAHCCYIQGAAPSHSSSVVKISAGTTLLLVFAFGLVVPYFGFGALYNYSMQGKSGKELIPNKDVWVSLPGLIKEGGRFTVHKLRSIRGGGGDYAPL